MGIAHLFDYIYIMFNNQLFINNHDSLTKVGNSRYFRSNLEQVWQNCLNIKASFSLIVCNINHFRSYNDIYGHSPGDQCLIEIANIIHNSVEDIDSFIARYGGDKFGIILPNSNENNTKKYEEMFLPQGTQIFAIIFVTNLK